MKQRSLQKELLDRDDIPAADIHRNMQELNTINTWLGGHRITVKGFQQLACQHRRLHVCEIGCGGGDNLAAVQKWAQLAGLELQVTGIDWNPDCLTVARAHPQLKGAQWLAADYRTVVFEEKPDIVFSSLFCHHFSNADLVQQLQWMQANSRLGFFINDLHRHALAFWSIKALTALCSRSYLVKNDAPISVARGFLKSEWEQLLQSAGIKAASVQWEWAFRHLIVVAHEPNI